MSKQLTAAAIAAAVGASPAAFVTINHPYLDGDINIKIHSVAEREAFEDDVFGEDAKFKDYPKRAVTFAHAVVDEKGNRLFGDDQIAEISKWPAYITMPVFDEFNKVNRIGPEKVAKAQKNS